MHAAERYDGVLDKLRGCNSDLEGSKEVVRDLVLRFEEVRRHRQELFRVSTPHYAVLCLLLCCYDSASNCTGCAGCAGF